jgi:hypothetical protein
VRYRKGAKPKSGGRGWGTIAASDVLPAPARARCEACAVTNTPERS